MTTRSIKPLPEPPPARAAVHAIPEPVARLLPILQWLPRYERGWFAPDMLAGLAIWAVMVPEGMAYAGIVGVPPIMGLYTIVPPLIVYALLGTSRRLVVGPDTATGVISALTVGALVARGSADFAALTSTLAILLGAAFLLFGLLRSGWVAAFVATPVMRGFIEGLVCVTIIGQVAGLLGLHGASGNFFEKLLFIVRHLRDVPGAAAATGLLSLAAMLLMRRLAPRLPAALIVAAAATLFISMAGEIGGISLVGPLPSGLPHLRLPPFDPHVVMALLPGILSIALVGYAEALGAAKAASDGERIDPNQELVAHGFANVAAGMFGGFLVVGSLSKTSVSMSAGARSQVANLIGAALCLVTLLFLTPLFRNLPHPTLAAIVIAAMLHLSKPAYLRKLAAEAPIELATALTVIAGELVLGVLQGIALGVVLSLLLLIYRASHPDGAVLGKLPGEDAYRDVRLHPDARTFPGLLIWNPGGPLFFANAERFETGLKAAVANSRVPVRQVLIDASAVSFIDSSAREILSRLVSELGRDGISISFARLRDPVLAGLRTGGIVESLGASAVFERLTEGVQSFLDSDRAVPSAR